jgi:hypothetical protein
VVNLEYNPMAANYVSTTYVCSQLETTGESTLKLISRTFPLLLILIFGAAMWAHAQSASVDFGVGTAADSSNGNRCINTFGEPGCFSAPKMTGTFGTFGANFMILPHIGVGGEYTWRFSQGSYGDIFYRPAFYDFNAIYAPGSADSKIVPQFQAGLGGADLKFYAPPQCDQTFGCSTAAQNYLASSNHFALHFGVGVNLYVRGGFFVRPQVDAHWVNNFTQFGSGWVTEGTVAIGYTLGRH